MSLTLEPGRLSRGIEKAVKQVGPAQFLVAGAHAPWYVDLDADEPCYCPDREYRGRRVGPCKHIVAALLHARHPEVLNAAGHLLLRREKVNHANV